MLRNSHGALHAQTKYMREAFDLPLYDDDNLGNDNEKRTPAPSNFPSLSPSDFPSFSPSSSPSLPPSLSPSLIPSLIPSFSPSSLMPSNAPIQPTSTPTLTPTSPTLSTNSPSLTGSGSDKKFINDAKNDPNGNERDHKGFLDGPMAKALFAACCFVVVAFLLLLVWYKKSRSRRRSGYNRDNVSGNRGVGNNPPKTGDHRIGTTLEFEDSSESYPEVPKVQEEVSHYDQTEVSSLWDTVSQKWDHSYFIELERLKGSSSASKYVHNRGLASTDKEGQRTLVTTVTKPMDNVPEESESVRDTVTSEEIEKEESKEEAKTEEVEISNASGQEYVAETIEEIIPASSLGDKKTQQISKSSTSTSNKKYNGGKLIFKSVTKQYVENIED